MRCARRMENAACLVDCSNQQQQLGKKEKGRREQSMNREHGMGQLMQCDRLMQGRVESVRPRTVPFSALLPLCFFTFIKKYGVHILPFLFGRAKLSETGGCCARRTWKVFFNHADWGLSAGRRCSDACVLHLPVCWERGVCALWNVW